ncbi:histidine kinase, partial [Streptomyces sp. MS2A]|nr:histidine kinase [Streptomyces sp. MS2A]
WPWRTRQMSGMVALASVLSVSGAAAAAVGALYSAAEQRRTGWAIGSGAVLLAVASYFRLDGSEPEAALNGYTFVTELALAAAAIALGVAVRLTREARERTALIAELTAAEQAHAAEARMQEERMGMARDLHDTIGHTLSVAALHAGVAAEATDSGAARAAIAQARAAASEALQELRRTVKVLRADRTTDPAPVLGLASADELFAAARAAGLRVDTDVAVPADALSPATDATAYRIVQESLTNVLRHAAASRAVVAARISEGELTLRITDDGRGAAPTSLRSGAGIRGMQERAALVGGTVTARPAPDGFVVEARLPLDPPAPESGSGPEADREGR